MKNIKMQIEDINYSLWFSTDTLWLRKDLNTENHKEGTESTKRSKIEEMKFSSVVLSENSVYSVVKNEIKKLKACGSKLKA